MTTATPSDVRVWARQQGLTSAERGPLPRAVLEAYTAAHGDTTGAAALPPGPSITSAPQVEPATGPVDSQPALVERLERVEAALADALGRLAELEAKSTRSVLGLRVTL